MAEFVEVMEQVKRICKSYSNCIGCPIETDCNLLGESENPKELEEIIMKWAKEHQVQTNADKFKEVFGKEPKTNVCVIKNDCAICEYREDVFCRNNWWNEEYKAPTEEEKK